MDFCEITKAVCSSMIIFIFRSMWAAGSANCGDKKNKLNMSSEFIWPEIYLANAHKFWNALPCQKKLISSRLPHVHEFSGYDELSELSCVSFKLAEIYGLFFDGKGAN